MSTVSNDRSEFWSTYFMGLAQAEANNTKQLDASHNAMMVQHIAFVLESTGSVTEKRVLDAGFGTGELARMLDVLGAKVSAIDVIPTRIPSLREAAPAVAWWQGDLTDWTLPRNAETFDAIVAVESLQFVDFDDTVQRLMSALAPAGRLIVVIPNSDCPIIQRTAEQFDHQFVGVSLGKLHDRVRDILNRRSEFDVRKWRVDFRGIYIQQDRSVAHYRSGPWSTVADPAQPLESTDAPPKPHFNLSSATPNRLQLVITDATSLEN